MKMIVFVCFLLLHSIAFSQSGNVYGIASSKNLAKQMEPSINDLQFYLSKATGHSFTALKSDTNVDKGVNLILLPFADSVKYAQLYLHYEDGALLQSNGKNLVSILAFTKSGLTNGIYTYLDGLGCKWYKPGDNQAIIPHVKNFAAPLEEVVFPNFVMRMFEGSFGTPRNIVVDRKKVVNNDWRTWQRRNRLGTIFVLQGHAWNPVISRNLTTLKNHPEYMALVKGERVKATTASKFCVSNPNFQTFFVNDMLSQLKLLMEKKPDQQRYIISVEPSDGDGFCTCDECKKMGTISDAVYTLANLTAREFQKVAPNAFVNLYAYNKHAQPPKFELEKNVIVQIIPYKYQRYAKPKEMIDAWKGKTDHFFIYDYYGLPINNLDMPLMKNERPEALARKIIDLYHAGITGITLESSYSTSTTGIGLYLLSRLTWNINENVDQLITQYYSASYGNIYKTIKQTDDSLASNRVERAVALQNAFKQINALNLKSKTDSIAPLNLTNYKAYLHYLRLLYDFKACSVKEANGKADTLIRFIYGTFNRKFIHPFPVSDYLMFRSKAREYVAKYWNYLKPTEADCKYSTITPLDDDTINKLFEDDMKSISKIDTKAKVEESDE